MEYGAYTRSRYGKKNIFFMTKEDLLELADMVERNSAYKYGSSGVMVG